MCQQTFILSRHYDRIVKKETAYLRDNPKLMAEWNYEKNGDLNPLEIKGSSSLKVWWKCEKGHEWAARIRDRIDGSRCPYCAGTLPIPGITDLATTHPHLAKEWHPTKNGTLTPFDVIAGSDKKVWWMCEKGHEWEAHVKRRSRGTGCPICNSGTKTSFPEQAIYFYLSKLDSKARNRELINNEVEVDIYLPSLNIGIEYDGEYFHAGTYEKEQRKNEFLKAQGIRLIRIKETKRNFDGIEYNGDVIISRLKDNMFI